MAALNVWRSRFVQALWRWPAAGAPMAHPQSQLVVAFAQALTDLITVEKKNIMALTEIARDALRTEPQAAPSLASLITSRIVQVGPIKCPPPACVNQPCASIQGCKEQSSPCY
jgi:hypothetical protein